MIYFSDLHVELLARGLLQPGERLVGQAVTQYNPWWAFGLVRKTFLVLATDQRLILVEHRFGFFPAAIRLKSVDPIPWSHVQEARVKGIFKKKLRVRAQTQRGPLSITMAIPNAFFGLLAPMKNNMIGARAVASAHEGLRQLASTPPPAPPAFAQQQQHAYPALNAPGYASPPPPPPAPQQGGYQQMQQMQQMPPYPPPGYPPRSYPQG
jgi:hypothetical protein